MDPYAELRRHAGGKHPQKSQLCVVLGAIEEVIAERRATTTNNNVNKPISPTEYFAAMMSALESATDAHQGMIVHLLGMVLPYVPEAVLRAKFSAIAQVLMRILQQYEDDEQAQDAAVVRATSTCLGLTLLAQEPSAACWSRPEVLRAFHVLLTFATDPRPKLRKVNQKSIADILQLHAEHHCGALSTHIASFTENVLAASQAHDEARLAQLMGFLKVVLPFLQQRVVASLVEALTKCMTSSSKALRVSTLEAVEALVQATTSKIDEDTLAKILHTALQVDHTVQGSDDSGVVVVVSVLELSLVRLSTMNEPRSRKMLPRVVSVLCACMENASERVQAQSAQSLLLILEQCVPSSMLVEEIEAADITRVLTSIQSLLTLRFQHAWPHVCPFLANLFTIYQEASIPALQTVLRTSCDLHEASEQLATMKSAATEDVQELLAKVASAAVAAIGPAKFLEIVPIADASQVILEQRAWLLPVFQQALTSYPCSLAFFQTRMLDLARQCEVRGRANDVSPLMAKRLQTYTLQIWRLFPTFCSNCVDVDTNFKKIAKLLANAMADKRYPELKIIVCQGLLALVKKACPAEPTEENEDEMEDAEANDKLAKDRAALAKFAPRYMPLFISFVRELDAEKDAEHVRVLLDALSGFASLADAALVTTTFRSILQTLLEATTDAKRVEAGDAPSSAANQGQTPAQLKQLAHGQLALAGALVAHMDTDSINLLYRVIKPYLLDDTDPALQKRSYAVLVSICDHHPTFLTTETNLQDMVESVCASLLTCSIPAKKMRLRCLVHLIRALPQDASAAAPGSDLIPNLVGEIMLCTKEANGKAREAAFELLITMAHYVRGQDASKGLTEFISMLLGGLAARTPHMRSAAVVCLSRVVFEFGREDATITEMMPQLLRTVLMLLHEKAREVIKSVIGFIKLGIAVLPRDQLEGFLPDLTQGLLVWIGESKNRFRAKTRIILIKLCRKFGYDAIASMVPVEDRALIKHIKRTREREDRKKQQKKSSSFEDFMENDDDDADEDEQEAQSGGEDGNTAFAAALRRKKALLKKHGSNEAVLHENEDEIVDFLDSRAAVKHLHARADDDSDDEDGIDIQTSKDGRLIIPDDDAMKDGSDNEDDIKNDVAAQLERMGLGKPGEKRKRRGEDQSAGQEYKARKAGGDIKKKGRYEPYAYIPLDPKLMARRNKRNAVNRYRSNVGKRKNLRS